MNIEYEALPTTAKLSGESRFDDLFICALGFEDRCSAAVRSLSEIGYRCRNAVMLKFDTLQEANERNLPELENILKEITRSCIFEPLYSSSDFGDIHAGDKDGARRTLKRCLDASGTDRVSIDISSFSTPMLIEVLDLLFKSTLKRLRILYTEGKEYPPAPEPGKEAEVLSEEFISTGLREIITPPAFKGIFTPGYSPLYIVFLGNEPMRARSMIDIYQPSRKIVVLVTPSKPELAWKLDLQKKVYKFSITPQDTLIELPNDYIGTYRYLEGVYDQFCQVNNINIVPLGSKMHTIAVWLFLERHPDVRLLIPLPMKYDPAAYSKGVGETYQIVFRITKSISNENPNLTEQGPRVAN